MSWFRSRVRGLDQLLLRRPRRPRRPGLDRSLALLSRAADRSMLWLGVAAMVAALAGTRGRRAAGRGLLSLALASALVNGPLKLSSRRRRPPVARSEVTAGWLRRPNTYSFPSGHTASAFAFATATALELPRLALPLAGLAAAVAYTRIHSRVHYASDVVAGAGLGFATALATHSVLGVTSAASERSGHRPRTAGRQLRFGQVVLVESPHALRAARGMQRVRDRLERAGLHVVKELHVTEVERLGELLQQSSGDPPLVLAAGGDGTAGAVGHALANRNAVMGVIPLGTSNDFARSLGVPMRIDDAVALLRKGKVSTIDLGRIEAPGRPARHFVHAATAGLNVSFAKLATQASFRKRLGRAAYAVAAAVAIREHEPFHYQLTTHGRQEELALFHLSVINAPVFGGFLGLRMRQSSVDDRLLDVLAVENIGLDRVLLAALYTVLRIRRPLAGILSSHVNRLQVQTDRPVDVALDGEVCASLPATFSVAGEALRVVTPQAFKDVDDPGPRVRGS